MAIVVQVTIDDAIMARALSECLAQETSLDDFIEAALEAALGSSAQPSLISSGSVAHILSAAIENAKKIQSGTTFHLDDVCTEKDWNALTSGDRKSLGKSFRQRVESSDIAKHVGRTSANKAIYRRL